jgi:O-antigen/teichoic acid export membrane protein
VTESDHLVIDVMRKNIIAFTLANLIGLALSTVSSLWMANIAGPRLMGMYNALQLLVGYAPILTFGIINGLNRELPYTLGRGEDEVANRLAAASHFASFAAAYATGLVLAICGVVGWIRVDSDWGIGLLAFAILVPLSLIRSFIEVTYRTGQDFVWLAWVKMFSGIIAVISVPLLYLLVWEGVLLRAIIIAVFGFYLLWVKRKLVTRPHWNYEATVSLVKVGLPIFIVGYLYTGFLSLDRVIIGARLGVAALGVYTPSILILQGMAVVPMSVMQVMYPRLAELYGKTGSATALLPLLFKPLPILFLVQLPFVVLGYWYLPEIIHSFMPKYSSGASTAQWAIVAGFVLSFSCPALAFNILHKQLCYGVIISLTAGVFLLVATILINSGFGLKGVTLALTTAFGFFVAGTGLGSVIICRLDGQPKI